jgi:hypothetical protein
MDDSMVTNYDFDHASFEARLGSFGVTPQYFGIDLQLTTATILVRSDTKVSPIPLSNCIVCAALVLSPHRARSNPARSEKVS